MCCVTEITLKMETELMAAKALELMKDVLAKADADGFELDSRKSIDRFADTLMVQGSMVVSSGEWGLESDTNHIVLPEMFKAVARCFCFDKFTAKVYSSSSYVWEDFEISYEEGELVINSLYHDNCEEPSCDECDDRYDYKSILRANKGCVLSVITLNILSSFAMVFAGYSLSFLLTTYEYEGNKIRALSITFCIVMAIWLIAKGVWTWWTNGEVGHTQEATQETAAILGKAVFD